MTFSITGRCGRTCQFGVAVSTSSVCSASRRTWARAGVGAAATHNITNTDVPQAMVDIFEAIPASTSSTLTTPPPPRIRREVAPAMLLTGEAYRQSIRDGCELWLEKGYTIGEGSSAEDRRKPLAFGSPLDFVRKAADVGDQVMGG